MAIGVYLYFQGNCREALDFYADAFKTEKPRIMAYGDVPGGGGDMPDSVKKLVLHANLEIAGEIIMFSDASPDRPITVGNNVSIMATLKTADQVRSVFDVLKVGGEVIMEVQETFFSKCYAYLIDKFGVSWQLNIETEQG